MSESIDVVAMIRLGATTLKAMIEQSSGRAPMLDQNGVHLSRRIDRALQRARRQGIIEYASPVQGWKLVK